MDAPIPRYRAEVCDPKGLAAASHAELAARCPHLAAYDPFDPGHLADPYPLWTLSQREAPVFFIPAAGMWAVTSYDLIVEVLRDTDTFSSAYVLNLNPVPDELRPRLPHGWPQGVPALINHDPPGHTPIRKLTQAALTPREVARREPQIREIARDLVDGFYLDGRCDLVHAFALPLPVAVIASLLGAPDEAVARFAQWAEDAFIMGNPLLSDAEILERGSRLADLREYLAEEIERRRVEPRDDLLSRLVHAEVEGEPTLTDEQVISVAAQMVIGGNETTAHLIANTVWLTRTRFPEVWDRMVADPSCIPAVVEESLRIKSSIRALMRTTTCETELGGVTLPEGAAVLVVFAAANHDAGHFPRADRFELDRPNINRHIAFGRLRHFCIGAPLARLEARCALEELVTRVPDLHLAEGQELQWLPSIFSQSLTGLAVAWQPRTQTTQHEGATTRVS